MITEWLNAAANAKDTKLKLHNLAEKNPFEIRLTSWGDGKIGDAVEIKY